jgi:hypothetical protein
VEREVMSPWATVQMLAFAGSQYTFEPFVFGQVLAKKHTRDEKNLVCAIWKVNCSDEMVARELCGVLSSQACLLFAKRFQK